MMKCFHQWLLRLRMAWLCCRLDWASHRETRVLLLTAREEALHRQHLATLRLEAQQAAARVTALGRRVVALADRMRGAA